MKNLRRGFTITVTVTTRSVPGWFFGRLGFKPVTPEGRSRKPPPHDIPGWFHASSLFENAEREARDGAHFVEVGAYVGKGTAFLACEIENSGK